MRAEAERDRVRGEGAHAIEELRREGSAVLAELKAGAKSRRELGQTLANAAARIDRVVPRLHDRTAPAARRSCSKLATRLSWARFAAN